MKSNTIKSIGFVPIATPFTVELSASVTAGATSISVVALPGDVVAGTTLQFSSGTLTTSADAAEGATTIPINSAAQAHSAGETATYESGEQIETIINGEEIGDGTTVSPDNQTASMARGFDRETLYQKSVSIEVRTENTVSTYQNLYVQPYGGSAPTAPTGPGDAAWDYAGRLDGDGSVAFTPTTTNDAAMRPIYRNMDAEVIVNALDPANYSMLKGHNDTWVNIALERADGSFRMLENVYASLASYNTEVGGDRVLMVRCRFVTTVFDIADVIPIPTGSLLETLNDHQQNGHLLKLNIVMLDGSVLTVDGMGFTIVPLEDFATATLDGYLVEGTGVSTDESTLVTSA